MKFGITQTFSCSYLPEQEEQLLVYAGDNTSLAPRYGQLIQAGFRRSGDQIYRPHCPSCNACQSLRIPVQSFQPSRSQKRLLAKNRGITCRLSTSAKESYYPLYERYINERHADGSMYPASPEQYKGFLLCGWQSPLFIEAYDDNKLIAVAVTDTINDTEGHIALSALYTFYDPDFEQRSLGTWMILQQIQIASQHACDFLYLGYQVDACKKMTYKSNFFPHQRFIDNHWVQVSKN